MKEKWEYQPIGSVCSSFSGYTPPASLLKEKGAYPYFKVAEMNFPQNKKILTTTNAHIDNPTRVFPKNSVVFPKNGAAIATNKKRILAQDSVVDLNTGGLIANDSLLNYVFFYYIMQHIDFRLLIRRGAVPTLDFSELKKVNIPIPSLDEQQQIVEELDLLSSIIDKKKEQLKELDNLAQSIFYDMFGTTNSEKGWDVKKFGDIGTFQRGGGFLKSDFIENGFPCIHYGQIHTKFGEFIHKHLTSIPEELAKSKSKIAQQGDVIIAITSEDVEGSCKSVAWLGAYDVAVGAHAAIFKHNMNPIYVSYYLKSEEFSRAKIRYAHGFKVVEIKPKDIAKIDILIPPLSLQQQFASKIEAIERQKELIKLSITEVETLFNSRMDYYFN